MAAYKEENGHIVIHNGVICDGTYYFLYECLYKCLAEAKEIVAMPEYSDYFYIDMKQKSRKADKEEIPEDKKWCTWYFSVDIILSNKEEERPKPKEAKKDEITESCATSYQRVEYIDTGVTYADIHG